MKEFVEKLIGRLEEKFKYNSEQAEIWRNGSDKDAFFREKKDLYMDRANTYGEVMRIVNQLAEEYKDKVIIDGQYCWQTCGATEHCKECNRLSNGSIDYYENYDCLAEEYNNGWISVSERLPVYLDNVLVCTENGGRTIAYIKNTPTEWVDMYMNKINNVVAWMPLPAPYQKGE